MSITIPAGPLPTSGSDCVNVTATEDDILNGDEDFVITITGTDLPEVTVGFPPTHILTIIDNEGMRSHCAHLSGTIVTKKDCIGFLAYHSNSQSTGLDFSAQGPSSAIRDTHTHTPV